MVIRNKKVRQVLKYLLPFVLIPGVILWAYLSVRLKNYTAMTVVIVLLAVLLFIAGFEKKKTGHRRLVIAAVMTALAVVGRFIPVIKPMTAVVIITGMYLGSETGFMTGALSAVISNFYFGQGPWTPFQMFSLGLIGFMAGVFARGLKNHRWVLLLYGAFSGVVYSLIMDIWTVLWYNEGFPVELYVKALATAVPYTVSYVIANVAFLWLLGKPFGDKLERMHVKYGI